MAPRKPKGTRGANGTAPPRDAGTRAPTTVDTVRRSMSFKTADSLAAGIEGLTQAARELQKDPNDVGALVWHTAFNELTASKRKEILAIIAGDPDLAGAGGRHDAAALVTSQMKPRDSELSMPATPAAQLMADLQDAINSRDAGAERAAREGLSKLTTSERKTAADEFDPRSVLASRPPPERANVTEPVRTRTSIPNNLADTFGPQIAKSMRPEPRSDADRGEVPQEAQVKRATALEKRGAVLVSPPVLPGHSNQTSEGQARNIAKWDRTEKQQGSLIRRLKKELKAAGGLVDERAAIMQFDGGLSQKKAEAAAEKHLIGPLIPKIDAAVAEGPRIKELADLMRDAIRRSNQTNIAPAQDSEAFHWSTSDEENFRNVITRAMQNSSSTHPGERVSDDMSEQNLGASAGRSPRTGENFVEYLDLDRLLPNLRGDNATANPLWREKISFDGPFGTEVRYPNAEEITTWLIDKANIVDPSTQQRIRPYLESIVASNIARQRPSVSSQPAGGEGRTSQSSFFDSRKEGVAPVEELAPVQQVADAQSDAVFDLNNGENTPAAAALSKKLSLQDETQPVQQEVVGDEMAKKGRKGRKGTATEVTPEVTTPLAGTTPVGENATSGAATPSADIAEYLQQIREEIAAALAEMQGNSRVPGDVPSSSAQNLADPLTVRQPAGATSAAAGGDVAAAVDASPIARQLAALTAPSVEALDAAINQPEAVGDLVSGGLSHQDIVSMEGGSPPPPTSFTDPTISRVESVGAQHPDQASKGTPPVVLPTAIGLDPASIQTNLGAYEPNQPATWSQGYVNSPPAATVPTPQTVPTDKPALPGGGYAGASGRGVRALIDAAKGFVDPDKRNLLTDAAGTAGTVGLYAALRGDTQEEQMERDKMFAQMMSGSSPLANQPAAAPLGQQQVEQNNGQLTRPEDNAARTNDLLDRLRRSRTSRP